MVRSPRARPGAAVVTMTVLCLLAVPAQGIALGPTEESLDPATPEGITQGLALEPGVRDLPEELTGAITTLSGHEPLDPFPGFRAEEDGSLTVLGPIDDEPGPIERITLPNATLTGNETGLEGPMTLGIFTRTWTWEDRPITTFGTYAEDHTGNITNVNIVAVEGLQEVDQAAVDLLQRDVLPVAVNSAPFASNLVHPTSMGLFLAFVAGGAAAQLAADSVAGAGYPELAGALTASATHLQYAPVFGFNTAYYPYHEDPTEGEVYRDFPDQYLWRSIQQVGPAAVWDGIYINRTGEYEETAGMTEDGTYVIDAEAWKRAVVGPVVRTQETTEKLPGLYLRQDLHRRWSQDASGYERFQAHNNLSSGIYSQVTGESPGPSVHMDEHKEGDQTFLYVPQQEDHVSVGVEGPDGFVPLLGIQTTAWHRPYTDTTNLGEEIRVAESYRLTSLGPYVNGQYRPVLGFDYWGERTPTDVWLLWFAEGAGLGDQEVGDMQSRIGAFHGNQFLPLAGLRWDDDFEGHDWRHRTMVSAGLFFEMPGDPTKPRPGEAPDGALYLPLVGTTYDGEFGSTVWTLAQVNNHTNQRGAWRVSSGVFAGDRYVPVVGAGSEPGSPGQGAAQGTYTVGVFLASYEAWVPLAGASYDGQGTEGSRVIRTVLNELQGHPDPGAFHSTVGAYLPEGYTPVLGVGYEPLEDREAGYGHRLVLGVYDPAGAFHPLLEVTMRGEERPYAWADDGEVCGYTVVVTVVPASTGTVLEPDCVR